MTLNEIYTTLLRRGMPRHLWLSWCTDGWRLRSERASDGEWVVSESDAADLLTMHAWRWHGGGEIRVAPEHVLMAILHATAHLEPK